MVVRCKPLTKDHLPLKTAISGPKGWSLVTGCTVVVCKTITHNVYTGLHNVYTGLHNVWCAAAFIPSVRLHNVTCRGDGSIPGRFDSQICIDPNRSSALIFHSKYVCGRKLACWSLLWGQSQSNWTTPLCWPIASKLPNFSLQKSSNQRWLQTGHVLECTSNSLWVWN